MTRLNAERYIDAAGRNPEILPYMLDLNFDRVLLARMSLDVQKQASFLDERQLTRDIRGEWVPWPEFRNAAQKAPDGAPAYLLHLSHCGSTLLSRLIQAADKSRVLREPLPLRTFAYDAAQSLDDVAFMTRNERIERIRIFEKTWSCGDEILIKATSICNDIADDLCDASPVAFAYVKPEIYLAAVLEGPNAKGDLRGFGQLRLRRWNKRSGWPQRMSDLRFGELAAMCWLTEATSIASTTRDVFAIDFDKFLAAPEEQLSALCRSLKRSANPAAIEQAVRGETMKRYSKDQTHAYDASLRARVLSAARARLGDEIREGVTWLENAAKSWKVAEAALHRFS